MENLKTYGIEGEAIELDVIDPGTIRAAVEIVSNRFGHLDVLVNNAAIVLDDQTKNPSEQSLDMWRKTFETNFFGLISVTQAFLPLLHKSNAGRIVNLSSGLASATIHADPNGGLAEKYCGLFDLKDGG